MPVHIIPVQIGVSIGPSICTTAVRKVLYLKDVILLRTSLHPLYDNNDDRRVCLLFDTLPVTSNQKYTKVSTSVVQKMKDED